MRARTTTKIAIFARAKKLIGVRPSEMSAELMGPLSVNAERNINPITEAESTEGKKNTILKNRHPHTSW